MKHVRRHDDGAVLPHTVLVELIRSWFDDERSHLPLLV